VISQFFVFEGTGENKRKMCDNEKSKTPLFFNENSRTLSFASWHNFSSTENSSSGNRISGLYTVLPNLGRNHHHHHRISFC
jgi:hypothetical protein